MKKAFSALLAFVMLFQCVPARAETDEFIFTDPVRAAYNGRANAAALIKNLSFTDISNAETFEAAVRAGALNVIKAVKTSFSPGASVTNVEMLASCLRVMGLESDAIAAAARLAPTLPDGSGLLTESKIGYLNVANARGFIDGFQYRNALVQDQSSLDAATSFIFDAPVTRQQAAVWAYRAVTQMNASAFDGVSAVGVQTAGNYADWEQIRAANLTAVEALVSCGALAGANGRLVPNGALTRGDWALLFKKLDDILLSAVGAQRKSGTVGGLKRETAVKTGSGQAAQSVYVRADDGKIDVLRNYSQTSKSKPASAADAPVFREGAVSGLAGLREGDEIEYVVSPDAGEVLYVSAFAPEPVVTYVTGKFQSFNMASGEIKLKDESGTAASYTLVSGLYLRENGADYIYVDYKKKLLKDLPQDAALELRLVNSICDDIKYLGEPAVSDELRGIVLENNPDLGYLIILDNAGRKIIKDYYESELKVTKREYYQVDGGYGYITELFPHFRYNPFETDIYAVEPGDIVFIRNDAENPDYIKNISASTNYTARYGKITRINHNGEYFEMLLEYENKQTAWFDAAEGVFITSGGKPVSAEKIKPGDWARVLLNIAVLEPGLLLESPKEIVLEGEGHYVSTILKGKLSGLNPTQNRLQLSNVQELTLSGWSSYKQAANFSVAGRDIEYFYDGRQISLDYALKYFKRSDDTVYVALEGNYAGEKVRKVTFRSGRDELLGADTVIGAEGDGTFSVLRAQGQIATDGGTIVRRFGRLVDGDGIMVPDYAVVSLNGGNNAAVVDIVETPTNAGVNVGFGTVTSVDEGKSFSVNWFYTYQGARLIPTTVQPQFAIDGETVFLTASGPASIDSFLGYTDPANPSVTTQIGQRFNIITDGSRAAFVIASPPCDRAVRGVVTANDTQAGAVHLKNAEYMDALGRWRPVSNINATLTINCPRNSVTFKNNEVAGQGALKPGNLVTVLTDASLPATVSPGTYINGYFVFVEN